jgi:transcriptional regulator with XRE-family HTH domain
MFRHEFAKELVKGSKLKRSAIAEECRITTETLTHYLNGRLNPSRAVATLLALTLNVPESELWTERSDGEQKAS